MSVWRACGAGFCHSETKFGKAIQWTTTKWWKMLSKRARKACPTHAYVWFRHMSGNVVYFEALEGEGFQGPYPIEKMVAWVEKDPENRWHKEYDLTDWVDPQDAYRFCELMIPRWRYNTKRLPLQLRTAGLGRRIIPASPNDVICSEADSRVLCTARLYLPEWAGKKNHDDMSPRHLMDAVEKLLEVRNK